MNVYIEETPELPEPVEDIPEPKLPIIPIISIVATTSGFMFLVIPFIRKRRIFAYIYDDYKLIDKVKIKRTDEILVEVDRKIQQK